MFPYRVFIFSVRVRCSSPRLVSWQLPDPRVSCPIPDPKTPEPNLQTPDISRHLQSPTPRCQTRKSKLHSPSTVPHRTWRMCRYGTGMFGSLEDTRREKSKYRSPESFPPTRQLGSPGFIPQYSPDSLLFLSSTRKVTKVPRVPHTHTHTPPDLLLVN